MKLSLPSIGQVLLVIIVAFVAVRVVSIAYLQAHLKQPPPKARVQDIRARMVQMQDPAAIQQWVATKLMEPRTNDFISWEDVPGGLASSIIIAMVERDGANDYIVLCFQAHGGVYGLAVASKAWTPSEGLFEYTEEWSPGVHVFYRRY